MNYAEEYRKKLITKEQAGALVKSGDYVDLYGYYSAGDVLDEALAERAGELKDVKVRLMRKHNGNWKFLEADPEAKSFVSMPIFLGPMEIQQVPQTCQAPIPALFYEYVEMYKKGDMRVDVGSRQVTPMSEDGYFNFSSTTAYGKAMADASRIFIAEVNTNLHPIKYGHEDRRIHISEVDYIVEGKNPVAVEQSDPIPTAVDKQIAEYIYGELRDGSCLQIGYGKVPLAVMSLIAESDLKDLGIHTELLSDALMKLYRAGLITGKHKNIDKGKMVYTLTAGTKELYDFAAECPDAYIAPVDYVNDPYIIGQNDNVVSINACLEFDITGQVNAETLGTRQISGTGGQMDFLMGSYRSRGGKSIIASPSTYRKKDGTLASRIVPALKAGAGITDPRMCTHLMCTEYGIVNIKGASMWERAEKTISIAHPDFRDELIREADKLGIWCRSNKR